MQHFDYKIISELNASAVGETNKETLLSTKYYRNLVNLLFCENANKIYHVYEAMVVLHICNRFWGILLPRYPENKKSNLDAYQILSCIAMVVQKQTLVFIKF